jgi:hypothetical protein
LGSEFLFLAEVVDLDEGHALAVINESKRPLLSILDDLGVIESTTNKTSANEQKSVQPIKDIGGGRCGGGLCVKDGVLGIESGLVLCSVTDETLAFGEGDVGRGDAVSLVVCDDFNICVVCPDLTKGIMS